MCMAGKSLKDTKSQRRHSVSYERDGLEDDKQPTDGKGIRSDIIILYCSYTAELQRTQLNVVESNTYREAVEPRDLCRGRKTGETPLKQGRELLILPSPGLEPGTPVTRAGETYRYVAPSLSLLSRMYNIFLTKYILVG